MKVQLVVQAEQELEEAALWYGQQAIGLDFEFLREFDAAVNLVKAFPYLFQEILPEIRRSLLNRFPYGVFYQVEEERILILAVAHLKRSPLYWISRVQV